MKTTNIPYSSAISSDKLQKVIEVCEKLKIQPAWLMGVIKFETAGTFDPAKTNNIGSVGLIQFTRDKAGVNYKTIAGKQYSLDSIKKMSFIQQMDLVYLYFKPYAGKINSFIDLYLITFFPIALNQPLEFVLKTAGLSAQLIATQNPIFDVNKDKKITKGEILAFFKSWYKDNFSLVNIAQDEVLLKKAKIRGWFYEGLVIIGLVFYSALSFVI